jgi:hypothetical protein
MMPCDHAATKGSLPAFLAVTTFVGFQVFPDGEVQLLANCKACVSTLSVVIEIPRGHVVVGEIEAGAEERVMASIRRVGNGDHLNASAFEAHARALAYWCPTCGAGATYSCSNDDPLGNHCPARSARVTETMEQHAERIIK